MQKNNSRFTLLFAGLLISWSALCYSGQQQQSVEFQPIDIHGCSPQNTQDSTLLVQNKSEFESLWKRFCWKSAPVIDFSQQSVIVIMRGARPNMGHAVKVTAVTHTENSIKVSFEETSPQPGFEYPQVITFPLAMVTVPRSDLPVTFEKVR